MLSLTNIYPLQWRPLPQRKSKYEYQNPQIMPVFYKKKQLHYACFRQKKLY